MTEAQKSVIRCAYLDLRGALEALKLGDFHAHDWKAHKQSINEIEEHFPDVIEDLKEDA